MSKQSSKRDVTVVFDLHRVLRKRSPRAMLFSIFAVALLLIGPLSLVIAGIGESSADGGYVGNKIIITYYPHKKDEKPTNIDGSLNGSPDGSNNYGFISVTYYGDFASTEYNPQYWNKDVNNGGSSALYSALIGTELEKWYPVKGYEKGKTLLFNGWVDDGGKSYDPGDLITKSVDDLVYEVNLYAKWVRLENHSNKLSDANSWESGTPYSNILHNCGELSYDINGKYTLRDCTINLGSVSIKDKTIIDNCTVRGTKGSGNHGEGDTGIFANGHKLILGSNIKGVPIGPNGASDSYTEASFAQIFGGSKNGTVEHGTNLIIHSGTFSNVVSGSRNGTVEGDTKVILKDVTILDTLTAGVDSRVKGSTYIYATAINMPGDSYEERELGSNDLPDGVTLTESTIITGGCNRAEVTVNTYVSIAGTSEIWDVQGAGRGGVSSVNESNVTIGGKAIVKHIVAGSITDGLHEKDIGNKKCVNNTNIIVKDQSVVCSVFGAGYDTFYKATYASMYDGGSIAVTIDGDCTVGYVYGGGYRGTIGTKENPIDSISININGGKVLNDVFGGGRGGLDKVCHNADGTFNWGSSHNDTTGFSIVYCRKITISISEGAIIEGNVYGGGESTPYITKYDDMDKVGKPNQEASLIGFEGFTGEDKDISLASVISDNVEINVNGIVHGSVFGAGKGISKKLDENNRHPSAYIFAMKNKKSVEKIPWLVKKNSNVYGTEIKNFSHDNYASVSSNIKINMGNTVNESTMDVPIVNGSIHGGGAFSKTYGNDKTISIEMTGGIVKESIFGGGKGSSENTNAGFVDVEGISINLTGGNVLKSVYGGGELAQTKTSSGINVIINGCEVASNVFGGGLGSSDKVSTKSKRKVTLVSGKVIGSIFGSSSLGNDGTENENEKFDSIVVIEGGEVDGSVYGGGFKGETHGNTVITITGGTILYSVYGGADVGDVNHESPLFNEKLVIGESTITVSGKNTSIGRSIFGSGNSCLVKGQKNVTISNVILTSMDSIQNVDKLSISDSTIHLSGRSDATTSQASTKYSLNNIKNIILEKNVELGLKSPTNEIGEYKSNGGTLSSPSNKLVLYGGLPLSVLSNQEVTEDGVTVTKEVYGKVSGYTILQTDNGKYGGAFAYGSKESTGTFVILKDGNYVESLTRDYSNPECRCWYIAGNVTYVTTIVADGKKANDSDTFVKYPNKIVGIPIQNTDSQLVYTGFDKKVPVNDRFNLVESVNNYPDFSMKVYGDGGSVTNNGIQLSNEVASIGNEYANYVMSVPNKLPSATIELTSSTNLTYTGLVATITIHLKEMREDNGAYYVVNSIDIIVNIHTEATSFPMDDPYDVVIGTRNGKGEAEFIIKRSYQGYTASIESIEGADLFSKITMESHLNKEGTLGWATPLSGKMPMSMISAGRFIGELTGSFSATIKFTSNYDTANGVPVSVAEVKIKLSNGNDADTKYFMLKISVRELESHRVTFVNMDEGLKNEVITVVSVYDGERILESQKPHTWDHFIDWYSDVGRNNLFDFTSPITSDTTIYSSYKYTVHFDDGYGSGWTTYVKIPTDGTNATIEKPKDPTRPPYVFNGWVDANNESKFNSGSEIITSDITFYAQWKGNTIKVELVVKEGDTDLYRIEGEVEYGKTYSELKFNDDGSFDGVTAHVKENYGYKGKFVRWAYYVDDGVAIGVYGDMVTLSNENHTLHAEFTDNAIVVKLVGREPEDYKKTKDDNTDGKIYWYGDWEKLIKIQAPTEMIVFKKTDGSCTFKLGNASFTGYKLSHWSFNLNGRLYEINPAETVQLTQGELLDVTKIEINPVWEHIKYEFKIEDPRGGSIIAKKTTSGVVPIENGTAKLYHGDKVSIKYVEGGGYTFSRWGQIGSSTFESNSEETTMTIGSNTTLYVVLGGLYDATVKLKVNGIDDNSQMLQLRSNKTTNAYGLVLIDGKYMHSEVKFGTYSVQIKCNDDSWLDVAEYTITGPNSSCMVELYTITINNGNDDEKITYPKFSVEGKEIVVKANDGYASVLTNTSPSLPEFPPLPLENESYIFKMPKSKVELTINVSVIEFNLVIDFDGGTHNGSVGPIKTKIPYFGIYDVDSIQKSLTKDNCTFGGWGLWKRTGDNNYEYIGTIVHGQSIAIYADQMLKVIWIDKEKYTIEYHLMNLDGETYAHHSTEIGSSDPGKVTIYPKKINGFKGPESVEFDIVEGGNNNFIIKYEREKYTVKFNINYQDNFYDSFNEIVEKIFFDEMISKILPMEKIKPGFEVKDGSVIDKVPVPDEGTTVEILVYATKITYRIDYNLGDNWILKEELKQYVISNEKIKLPEAERSGYEFKGWKNANNDVWHSIPTRETGDLILTPNYSKLPVITIINWEVVSVTSDHFVKQSNGIYVSKNSNGGSVTFKYENGDETVYKYIINGGPVDSSGNQCGFEVKEDTTVFAYPKLRDVNTDPAPLDVMRITLAFTKNVNGEYSATIDGSLTYDDGFIIDLKKYGGNGENPSIEFTKNNEVNIKGLAGMTGTLFIKESSMKYNVEITLYIISNISDSDLRGTSTITINDGRSNVLDSQTFSDYILPSEGGEVIE